MATLLPEGKQSFTTSAGVPLVGGKLYTYDAGTNNPRATYSDSAGTVPNTNPVILDARGEATVFWDGTYKVVLKDAFDATIWTLDNVASGNTYSDTLRADLADAITGGKGSSLVGNAISGCVSRAVLKALDTTKVSVAYLREAGREGLFKWTTGDFSAKAAADTQEGIFLVSNGVSSNAGAWVRVTPNDGEWYLDWFGVPADPAAGNGGGSQVSADVQLTAVINLGNIVKPSKIIFGSKIYTITAQLPQFNWQVILQGSRGAQSTILVKRYVEGSATRGILAFNDFGFSTRDITLRATSGSGGAGISAILTLNAPASGRTYLERTYISTGDFCNYALFVDGSTNVTVSGPSYRGLFIIGGEYFGAAFAAISLNSVNHLLASSCFVTNSGGTSALAFFCNGNVNAYNDDFQFQGIIGGRVDLRWLGRSAFVTPMIDNWTVDANTTKTMRVGHRFAGVLTNNAAAGEYVDQYDGTVVASGGNSAAGWRKWGSGKIQQWGTVTTVAGVLAGTAWPLAFGSSNINCHANVGTDQGANIAGMAQIIPVAGNTNYDVKSYNFNYSTGATGGSSVVVRWFADGQ